MTASPPTPRTAPRCGSRCGGRCTSRSTPAPHVLEDVVGLQLAAPDDGWRDRPDMHPLGTRGFRASIVARARFIEDLVAEQAAAGVTQYVILGAGLDTLAQRRPDLGDAPADLRGRPARHPGVEAPPPGRARLRRPRLAATRCRSTSRRARAGGTGWPPPASTPAGRRSSRPPASACTSPRTPPRPRCASSPRSPPAPRSR